VYREQADREAMFTAPEYVFKDGELVARKGRIVATPTGGTHYVEPEFDRSIERKLTEYSDTYLAFNFRHAAIGRDELCTCCNGGRLLPAACGVHKDTPAGQRS
jgi:formylmethanofuran dehydrogenase subunit A